MTIKTNEAPRRSKLRGISTTGDMRDSSVNLFSLLQEADYPDKNKEAIQ